MSNKEKAEEINEIGMVTTKKNGVSIHCITIIGQIEGHQILSETTKTTKYEHLIPVLASLEESEEIHGLLILINTIGGDVEAGLALAELIAGMKTPTVSLVLGGGHSIGVPLAVSAKKTFIVKSATMTVHPVRVNGLVIGTEKTFDYFEKIQARIEDFIVDNSSISKARLGQLMHGDDMTTDVGTIVGGEEAVRLGLCHEVGSLSAALAALHEMIQKPS